MSRPDRRVLIMGAAGRDFHDFATVLRDDARVRVVAFTATQIPFIDGRNYPPELAGPRYPDGIPVYPEHQLETLIAELGVDEVVFSYSDVSHLDVMRAATRVLGCGATFTLLGPAHTMVDADVPVVAVTAVRTGAGKSPTSRAVCRTLRAHGLTPVVVRHPMPYGDLSRQRVQRFTTSTDLDDAEVTIEEREEYEPHLAAGTPVVVGIEPTEVVGAAQVLGDVIVFDGGNNDHPLLRPDVHLTIVDPFRAADASTFHPGAVNLHRADVVIITKVDTASPAQVAAAEAEVRGVNPDAPVIHAALPVTTPPDAALADARVLIVEDGPTLTHGGMRFGAGTVAARQAGVAAIVDPRPYAVGSVLDALERYDVGALLPALGYAPTQLRELEKTIAAVPCDVVIVASPVDLSRLIHIEQRVVRATYEFECVGDPTLEDALRSLW